MTLTDSINSYHETQKKARSLKGLFLKRHYRKKLSQKSELLDSLLTKHLSETNERFNDLVRENLRLLSNRDIKFVVTQEGASPWTYATTSFAGSIHGNGFLYLKATKNAIEWVSFQSNYIPTRFDGTINATGQMTTSASRDSFQILGGQVPSNFIGRISEDGQVYFETNDSWFELGTNSHINKIIADPFNGNSRNRRTFLANRSEIRQIMDQWKIENNVGQQRT